MANGSDDKAIVLLREILATQEVHSDKFRLLDAVGMSVANLHEDMRVTRAQVAVIGEQVDAIGRKVDANGGKVDAVGGKVDAVGANVESLRAELDVVHADAHDTRVEIHEMRGDIRELQTDLGEVRRVADSHSLRFDFLDERVELLREGALAALSSAANSLNASKQMRDQIGDLTKRVEKLESLK